jgi:hypothetical protein
MGDFRVVLHLRLQQDVGPIAADGLHAQAQLPGDRTDRVAGGDHDHHLVFAIRKVLVGGVSESLSSSPARIWASEPLMYFSPFSAFRIARTSSSPAHSLAVVDVRSADRKNKEL